MSLERTHVAELSCWKCAKNCLLERQWQSIFLATACLNTERDTKATKKMLKDAETTSGPHTESLSNQPNSSSTAVRCRQGACYIVKHCGQCPLDTSPLLVQRWSFQNFYLTICTHFERANRLNIELNIIEWMLSTNISDQYFGPEISSPQRSGSICPLSRTLACFCSFSHSIHWLSPFAGFNSDSKQ